MTLPEPVSTTEKLVGFFTFYHFQPLYFDIYSVLIKLCPPNRQEAGFGGRSVIIDLIVHHYWKILPNIWIQLHRSYLILAYTYQ